MGRVLDIVVDLILVVVVERVLESAVRGLMGHGNARMNDTGGGDGRFDSSQKKDPVRGTTVRDPVCGMFVSTELSHRLNWHGETLHFCSEECLKQYRKSATA